MAAGKIKGLFPEAVPQVRQEVCRHRPSRPPTPPIGEALLRCRHPYQRLHGRLDGIGERLKGFAEVSKAAARLAAAQARKAHLVNLALPAAYLGLGRDIYAAGRFREEFPELYTEIGECERQAEQVTSARPRSARRGAWPNGRPMRRRV